MEPNKTFEDRLNQVYNLFNASTVLTINTRYGPSWLLPSNVLGARLFKFGVQVNF